MPDRKHESEGGAIDAPRPRPAPVQREITYRVGWRSGTIRLKPKEHRSQGRSGDSGKTVTVSGRALKPPKRFAPAEEPLSARVQQAAEAASAAESAVQPGRPAAGTASGGPLRYGRIAGLIFAPAPQPSLRVWRASLPALTLAGFAALLWLASRLTP